ncbi:hypothetical protein KEM56_002484 [Ascosphaera pollenicola]|nr:hypothetical protein KEM56_002484 [Ascosphaera pollenicola]
MTTSKDEPPYLRLPREGGGDREMVVRISTPSALMMSEQQHRRALIHESLANPEQIIKHASAFFTPSRCRQFAAAAGVIALYQASKCLKSSLTYKHVNNGVTLAKFQPSQEIAVVTGGLGAIGWQVVMDLLKIGLKGVAILDIQEPPQEMPDRAYFYKTDVTSPEAVSNAAANIRKQIGEPTILVNNAGVGIWGPILQESQETLKKCFETNILSHWTTVQEFMPYMIEKNHGHIVSIASTSSFVGVGEIGAYAATKAAVMSFHESLTQELRWDYRADRVRTSLVHPNWLSTPMTAPMFAQKAFKTFGASIFVEDVAREIVKQIINQVSGQVIIPKSVTFLSYVRAAPNWFQERLRGFPSRNLIKVRQLGMKQCAEEEESKLG